MKAGRYSDAVYLVDKVDWRKEEDNKRLIQAAEAYRRTRRYDDAVNILKMAHNRKPNNKKIVYLLCETYFESKDVVTAQVYLDRYQSMTDKSDWHYDALKYKRALAYDLPVMEKIDILVELKKKEPAAEQFRYELAKLYNQARQYAECAAECDELILLFGDDGKYARKALELKKTNVPLTEEQETLLRRLSLGIKEHGDRSSSDVKMMNTMDMSALNLESNLAKDIQTLKSEEGRETPRRKRPEFKTKSLEQTVPPSTQEVFFSDKTEDIRFTQYDMGTAKAGDIQEIKAPLDDILDTDDYDDKPAEGQITMDDLLSDWSKIKERNTQNLKKTLHEDLVEQTGKIFEKKKEENEEDIFEEEPGSIWKEVEELADIYDEQTGEEEAEESSVEIEETADEEVKNDGVLADNFNDATELEEKKETVSEEVPLSIIDEAATKVIPDIDDILAEDNEEENEEETSEEIPEETPEEEATSEEEIAANEEISADEELPEEEAPEPAAKEEPKQAPVKEVKPEATAQADDDSDNASDEDSEESEENQDSYDEEPDNSEDKKTKDLSPEERKLFSQFLHPRSMRTQIANALDNISLAAYVGNVIITTDNVETGFSLAKAIVKFVKFADVNFSGAMSRISATDFNNKNVVQIQIEQRRTRYRGS